MKLFTTIARDLADRDLCLQQILAEVISDDHSLRDTADIAEQWQKFILEPFSQLEGSLSQNVVIIIDALDESGAEATRQDILNTLAHGAQLPSNIRIVLTSRPIMDIRQALLVSHHVQAKSLDDIEADSATCDITHYISTTLKKVGAAFSNKDLEQLAAKSNGLFEWARLACDFLRPRISMIANERFCKITSHAGDGANLLDGMYVMSLKDLIQGDVDVLERFHSVMRQILWLKEPLSISALDSMRCKFTREGDHFPVGIILGYMASFLTGTINLSTPVRPMHASFYDFLLDKKRSGEFFVDEADVHHELALASLCVMQDGLRFNICGLETSYVRNSAVADLAMKIEKNIPLHLLYSCRFWATHLHDSRFDTDLANHVVAIVTGAKILYWMEVLGVCKCIGEADRALTSAEGWLQVSILYCTS